MDAKLKAKWVKALRSGKYRQGQHALRTADGGFCCVGVLCAIQGEDPEAMIDEQRSYPLRTTHEAGIGTATFRALAQMNDEGKSFSEIADYIEQNL